MLLVTEQPLLGGVGLEAVHQPVWAAQRWGCARRRSRRRTHKAETLSCESGVMGWLRMQGQSRPDNACHRVAEPRTDSSSAAHHGLVWRPGH